MFLSDKLGRCPFNNGFNLGFLMKEFNVIPGKQATQLSQSDQVIKDDDLLLNILNSFVAHSLEHALDLT
jgi:hypothetical protein